MLNHHVARRLFLHCIPFQTKKSTFNTAKAGVAEVKDARRVCSRRSLDQSEFIKPSDLAIASGQGIYMLVALRLGQIDRGYHQPSNNWTIVEEVERLDAERRKKKLLS